MPTPTIATFAAALPNAKAIPTPIIIQIVTDILSLFGLGGICPAPATPPAVGPGERWWVRKQVRNHLDDPAAYREWGMQMADDALEAVSKSTPEVWAKMVSEAQGA